MEDVRIARRDLEGFIGLKFRDNVNLDTVCERFIPNYTKSRFEALAVRFFLGREYSATFYVIDKEKNDGAPQGTIPVKKFKIENINLRDFLEFMDECNFTITTGAHPIEEIEVINK